MNVLDLEKEMPLVARDIRKNLPNNKSEQVYYEYLSDSLLKECDESILQDVIGDNCDIIADFIQLRETVITSAYKNFMDYISHEIYNHYYESIDSYKRENIMFPCGHNDVFDDFLRVA